MRVTGPIVMASVLACLILTSCGQENRKSGVETAAARPLVVYSSLPEGAVRALTEAYTRTRGVAINYMLDSERVLIEKLVTKEHHPAADLLLIDGADNLQLAVESDVLRPINSARLKENIRPNLRDSDNYWFGLSTRRIPIVYDDRSVDPGRLFGYSGLADDFWADKLCLLTSSMASSRTLVSSLIVELGERDAELVVRGWRKNLAAPVFSSGRELLLAIESGRCHVGIVASDALAMSIDEGIAPHAVPHWPSMAANGTQLNLLGAGVTRHAASPDSAVDFLEWLTTVEGQRILNRSGRSFPVNPEIAAEPPLDKWVSFELSPIESARVAYVHKEASLLTERARYR